MLSESVPVVEDEVSKEQLDSALSRAPQAESVLVSALLASSGATSFRLARQRADRSRQIFETKYSLAIERGVVVHGLPALLDALAVMGLSETYSCAVVGEHAAALFVLDSSLEVVGTLYIERPDMHVDPEEQPPD